MSPIKKLITQSSHYLLGHSLAMAAGFLSFPILTRIFSIDDYGTLGLISTTLFIAYSLAKQGSPSSIVRFYPEYRASKNSNIFCSTMFLGYTILAIAIAIFLFIFSQIIPPNLLGNTVSTLLSLTSVLVILVPIINLFLGFWRAQQRSKLYNLVLILNRYGLLFFGISFLFLLNKDLYAYYTGQIIFTVLLSLFLIVLTRIRQKLYGKP